MQGELRDLGHAITRDICMESPDVRWADIAGLEDAKRRVPCMHTCAPDWVTAGVSMAAACPMHGQPQARHWCVVRQQRLRGLRCHPTHVV